MCQSNRDGSEVLYLSRLSVDVLVCIGGSLWDCTETESRMGSEGSYCQT